MTDCELTNLRTENKLLAEELEKHREAIRRLAEQDATLSVHDGRVIVTMDATLTDEERDALDFFGECGRFWSTPDGKGHASTLRALLERTK
jgi:hypothetical protein